MHETDNKTDLDQEKAKMFLYWQDRIDLINMLAFLLGWVIDHPIE